MAIEIERKFLMQDESWRKEVRKSINIVQGYLNSLCGNNVKSSVRIRIEDKQANLNIKSLNIGTKRNEYQINLPLEMAQELLNNLAINLLVVKTRHVIFSENLIWEIDEFHNENQGLILAEVELKDEKQKITIPKWLGKEVTMEKKYYNVSLSIRPYREW